jgi:tetratricopeptide (TPR) repeat protein
MMRDIKLLAVICVLGSAAMAADVNAREEGITAFNEGRYSVALSKLKEAAGGGDHRAAIFLALTQAAAGDCASALPVLTKTEPASDATLRRLAGLAACKCYSKAGDLGKSVEIIQDLERRYPNDPDVLYTAAKLHMKAFNDVTFAMFQRTPASYRVHELSAEIFEVENRYSEAASEYREAIKLSPKSPDLHYRLGRTMLLQSHSPDALAQAAAEFKAELLVNPEDGASEFQLGQIAQTQGSAPEAQSHFERALHFSPDFIEALVALGKMHTQQKHYEKAIPLLVRAAELQPKNEAAHYSLLTAYRDSGQMDKAKAEKAILDNLQKAPQGEFSNFLKKLGEKPSDQ